MSVSISMQIDDYTNRVLGVIKEKFGLKDKTEALNKFAAMYGEEFVEREIKEEVIKEMIEGCEQHIKKHGFRKMSLKELDKLCGM